MFDFIESHLPKVRQLITPAIFNNDTLLRESLRHGYNFLPYAVRLFVKEEAFINYCLSNKNSIFGKASSKKPAPKQPRPKAVKATVKPPPKKKAAPKKTAASRSPK